MTKEKHLENFSFPRISVFLYPWGSTDTQIDDENLQIDYSFRLTHILVWQDV